MAALQPFCTTSSLLPSRLPPLLPVSNPTFPSHLKLASCALKHKYKRSEIGISRGKLVSLVCEQKCVAEEKIEKPTGIPLTARFIGDKPRCPSCEVKGLVLCVTCTGSGLYVDSIMESQGIIVKVRCLGCGGTGSIMCSECGGRGHL